MLCRQPSRNSVGAGSFPYLSHSDGYETRIKASVKDASLRVKVSYAVSAALSAVGDNRLLPSPQNSVLVINMKSGYVRQNQSYVISRIFRDYDYWKDPQIDKAETQRLADLQQLEDDTARIEKRDPVKVRMGLRLAIYEATEKSGSVKQDNLWRSGIIVVLVQLGIAAVPWAIHEEWLTFFVTGVGTLLALASGALPQWAEEKWACRRKSDKTVVLTSGNGAHDAIVVIGNGRPSEPDTNFISRSRSSMGCIACMCCGIPSTYVVFTWCWRHWHHSQYRHRWRSTKAKQLRDTPLVSSYHRRS
jgi:hypothetical protein